MKVTTPADSILVKPVAKRMPPAAGKGRKPGCKNKIPTELKKMILGALENAGGEAYLEEQAHKNPVAFLALIGKILPGQLHHSGEIKDKMTRQFVFRIYKPGEPFPVLEAGEEDSDE